MVSVFALERAIVGNRIRGSLERGREVVGIRGLPVRRIDLDATMGLKCPS
jgi:hypothetical protein